MTSKAVERLANQFIEAVHPTMRMQFADAIEEALRERERDIIDRVHAAVTYYCGGPKLRAMTPRETADWIIKRAGLPSIDEALRNERVVIPPARLKKIESTLATMRRVESDDAHAHAYVRDVSYLLSAIRRNEEEGDQSGK